ncbi:MAG: ferrous iron transport protein B [Desulfomonilaceae bacterium]
MMKKITVALAGNPNAGKTTIFNALTGARQHVGNWPGVTVEKKEGIIKHAGHEIHVIDLPGTYSLTAYSLEELIARNFIVESRPDVVVDVVDASNLQRNLYLAAQLMEMGAKLVIALNMIDVAHGRSITIDHKKLSELLGVAVIPTNGKKGMGIEELLQSAIEAADSESDSDYRRTINYGTEIEEELDNIEKQLGPGEAILNGLSRRWLAIKLLEGDSDIVKKIEKIPGLDQISKQVEESRKHLTAIFADSPEILLTDARYGFASGAVRRAVEQGATDRVHLSEAIDRMLTHRFLGPAILVLVIYGLYTFTFRGSQPLVDALEFLFNWLSAQFTTALPEGILKSLVVSGIIDGVGGVLRFTPLIAFMFLAIAILEDTGYMARMAFMLDRVLRSFGLHGASMLALMVSGGIAGGCAVPGIMATRTLKEPKERLVTILVAPLMNCGAKMPVYALLIGAFFAEKQARMMLLLTLISWFMALMAGRIIRSTVLKGPSAPFVLELPPYRLPTLRGLLIHTWERTWMYLKKAGTVILAVSIVLWATMTFPSLPKEKSEVFEQREQKLTEEFLKNPQIAPLFKSETDIEQFEKFRGDMAAGKSIETGVNPALIEIAQRLKKNHGADKQASGRISQENPAQSYAIFMEQKRAIESERLSAQLQNTIGGRIGIALETVFKPIGFDWRTNVALLGGFAAKEVVVATLGTAYSLGEVKAQAAETLSAKLKKEPGWNPLMAFTLIMFVMLYNPCLTTLVVIKKESGKWRWTLFAMAYTTILAYCVALTVHLVGSFLGIGVN